MKQGRIALAGKSCKSIKKRKASGKSDMKRYLACWLMLIVLISLIGCNSQDTALKENPQEAETSSQKEDVLEVILFVVYDSDSSISKEIIDYLRDEEILANEWSVETEWADNGDIDDKMDYAVRKGFDMIVCASDEIAGAMRLYESQYPDIEFIILSDW